MDPLPLSLPLSQIIAPDAPLSSPVSTTDSTWDMQQSISPTADAFNFTYYNLPPSPPHSIGSASASSPDSTSRMLKMRMSPDSSSEGEQLCLPTHQVFDFPPITYPPTPPTPAPLSPQRQQAAPPTPAAPSRPTIAINSSSSTLAKRSASPATSTVTTKKRAVGERISSKDFIPPDVTGLSKREARLVKNRAAAFLSRQRKREEFESMEVRVAELEQENARLLALTQNGNSPSPDRDQESPLVNEVEQLRAQLAAAKEREQQLNAELAAKASVPSSASPIKVESQEPSFSLSSASRSASSIPAPYKSGASLGLMVLLCALPTLLSMPTSSTAPSSYSFPTTLSTPSSAIDFNHIFPNDYDWSRPGNSMMDLDSSDHHASVAPSAATTRKLEFSTVDSDALAALGGLDVSFDASPSEDGKIRVRIHPSSSKMSTPNANGAKTASGPSLAMWAGPDAGFDISSDFSASSVSGYTVPPAGGDPFLGIGSTVDYSGSYSVPSSLFSQMGDLSGAGLSDSTFGYPSEFSIGDSSSKRRVRIALKSMPVAGGEGGEWEVQIC
ncbi:hypothetical protein AX16_004033 [Volvariella volvacea WC 439]|nr:hypothetical protein AX16_004033 [Volvariella volvacea WC 439]